MQWIKTLRKKLWIIVLLPLVAAGSAYAFSSYLLKPVYESDTTLYVNNNGFDSHINSDTMLTRQYFARDYRELIKSRAVLTHVIEELQLKDTNPKQLAKNITVESKNNSNLIEIRIRSNDALLAMQIADMVGSVFVREAAKIIEHDNIRIVDRALYPEKPQSPDIPVNVAAAFISGILFAFGIVFLTDYLDTTLKTEQDIEKHLKLNIIGIIPKF